MKETNRKASETEIRELTCRKNNLVYYIAKLNRLLTSLENDRYSSHCDRIVRSFLKLERNQEINTQYLEMEDEEKRKDFLTAIAAAQLEEYQQTLAEIVKYSSLYEISPHLLFQQVFDEIIFMSEAAYILFVDNTSH